MIRIIIIIIHTYSNIINTAPNTVTVVARVMRYRALVPM